MQKRVRAPPKNIAKNTFQHQLPKRKQRSTDRNRLSSRQLWFQVREFTAQFAQLTKVGSMHSITTTTQQTHIAHFPQIFFNSFFSLFVILTIDSIDQEYCYCNAYRCVAWNTWKKVRACIYLSECIQNLMDNEIRMYEVFFSIFFQMNPYTLEIRLMWKSYTKSSDKKLFKIGKSLHKFDVNVCSIIFSFEHFFFSVSWIALLIPNKSWRFCRWLLQFCKCKLSVCKSLSNPKQKKTKWVYIST